MSVIWGMRSGKGTLVNESDICRLGIPTQRYAEGSREIYAHGPLGMGAQVDLTHKRAAMDGGLVRDASGNALSFDGRLDNAHELASALGFIEDETSDAQLVLAAYLRWKEKCFGRFTGDWALALWFAKQQRLTLAQDHAGTRTLYFAWRGGSVLWSTYLETFAASDKRLSESYAGSYMSCVPTEKYTPYENVVSVLPGQYIVFGENCAYEGTHWSPYVRTTLRYQFDREYDEHFLRVFGQSVVRRTGPDARILAQLSGGMDSTAIVCMSDHLRRSSDPESRTLDTISFYDDSEGASNERDYFTITEAKRGKAGIHLDTSMSQRTFEPARTAEGAYQIPGCDSFSLEQEKLLFQLIWEKGHRVILSGIGGDEVLGGVPSGLPELSRLLVRANFIRLFRQSTAWCLTDRSPLLYSLLKTAGYTSRLYLYGVTQNQKSPPWLSKRLKQTHLRRGTAPKTFIERLLFAPHQLDNAETWAFVMDTLPHKRPQLLFRPEFRYPMLDKDLVEFLFSIPREQLVKPGRRRCLMRRALRGIVPQEILERRRKAFHVRGSLKALEQSRETLHLLWRDPLLAQAGFIDVDALRRETEKCVLGEAEWSQALMRTVAYELWLQSKVSTDISVHPAGDFARR